MCFYTVVQVFHHKRSKRLVYIRLPLHSKMSEDVGNISEGSITELFPSRDLARLLRLTFPFPRQTLKASGLSDDVWTGRRIAVQSEGTPVLIRNKRAVVVKAEQSRRYTFFLCSLSNCCHQALSFSKC